MQMLPLTYLIQTMGSKTFWNRLLIVINQQFDVKYADFLHYAISETLWPHDATNRKQD